MKDNCTRGVRGISKLNRTLDAKPRHRLASLGNPKKKNTPCFFDLRGGDFFKKWKGYFSFWVLPSKYSGSVAGLQCGLAFAKAIFWGFGFSQKRD